MNTKIMSPERLRRRLDNKKGTTVLTGGCFDILHRGHVRHLQAASRIGDILIVAVDDDATVRRSKGTGHPYMPLRERMEILAALQVVDYVTWQSERNWIPWLVKLKPDVYVKGVDWRNHLPKSERMAVIRHGGRIVFLGDKLDSSTRLQHALKTSEQQGHLCASV